MSALRAGRTTAVSGAFAAALLVLGGCGSGGPDQSYFTVRPVTRSVPPPCVAPAVPLVPPPNVQVTACYELGPPGVDAGDVRSAKVTSSEATQLSEVEFQLTPAGVKRWNTTARSVGVGGQLAIVVDGTVTSAPRLETTDFQGRGVVTGLDAVGAQRLSERINRS